MIQKLGTLKKQQPDETTRHCTSLGRRQGWELSTDRNGVGVWPNTSLWKWDEPRTRTNTDVDADKNAKAYA